MDRTEKILHILKLFLDFEKRSTEAVAKFKVRAYENAIEAVSKFGRPITNESDVKEIKGIGDKIRKKLIEIVETGELKEAEGLEQNEKIFEELLGIYGIGKVKANDFIKNYNIQSIADIQLLALEQPELFTEAQMLGLAYYSDLNQRIPRIEMVEHEKFLRDFFLKYEPEFSITVVGSYRRNEPTSGDVDLLITYSNTSMNFKQAKVRFQECIDNLIEEEEYIIGVLARGTKFMGVCKMINIKSAIARRIDILLTPPEEFPYALMYFTGSKNFNVNFRKAVIANGYTLNEHTMKKVYPVVPDVPEMKTEKDIFDFVGVKYLTPEERIGLIEMI